ncbi:prostaglandin D2 receptor 2-like [Melanotaenia boesemani]|uniref:prostaglandin D2 receptor 2-like n=1 Tax=Melanotaenia boesemani TaxID=1250792 RepID=UPI001C04FC5F|nr:prostaglandin D2 receptor 2-like [Melanotaenia boesemani]
MSNMYSNSTTSEGQFCPQLQMMRDHGVNNNTKVNLAVVCVHGLVSCLGILENALIIWVVGFRLRNRTVASVWVLNLAMSDFLATLTLPLFTIYLHSSHSWELGNPLCKAKSSIFFLNMFVSAFLLAAISLDRLLLVVKPVWSQNHRSVAGAWKVCALGWLWAALNTAPYSLFRSVVEKRDGRKLCYHNFAMFSSAATLERDCNVMQRATAISKLLLAFLFPLVVIAGSYIQIGLSLRKRDMRRRQSASKLTNTLIVSNSDRVKNTPTNTKTNNFLLKPFTCGPSIRSEVNTLSPTTSSPHQNQLSQSFTKMVSCVIAAFALCWAPYHIFATIELSDKEDTLKLVETWLPLAATLAFLNPLLNPILYAFSCPHFCVRIQQSLGALFDGLVEEGEGILMVSGKSLRAHMKRKSSRDGSLATPGSPEGLCQSPDI